MSLSRIFSTVLVALSLILPSAALPCSNGMTFHITCHGHRMEGIEACPGEYAECGVIVTNLSACGKTLSVLGVEFVSTHTRGERLSGELVKEPIVLGPGETTQVDYYVPVYQDDVTAVPVVSLTKLQVGSGTKWTQEYASEVPISKTCCVAP